MPYFLYIALFFSPLSSILYILSYRGQKHITFFTIFFHAKHGVLPFTKKKSGDCWGGTYNVKNLCTYLLSVKKNKWACVICQA